MTSLSAALNAGITVATTTAAEIEPFHTPEAPPRALAATLDDGPPQTGKKRPLNDDTPEDIEEQRSSKVAKGSMADNAIDGLTGEAPFACAAERQLCLEYAIAYDSLHLPLTNCKCKQNTICPHEHYVAMSARRWTGEKRARYLQRGREHRGNRPSIINWYNVPLVKSFIDIFKTAKRAVSYVEIPDVGVIRGGHLLWYKNKEVAPGCRWEDAIAVAICLVKNTDNSEAENDCTNVTVLGLKVESCEALERQVKQHGARSRNGNGFLRELNANTMDTVWLTNRWMTLSLDLIRGQVTYESASGVRNVDDSKIVYFEGNDAAEGLRFVPTDDNDWDISAGLQIM